MGMPMDMWFDDLVQEHPPAEKYRKNVDRIVEMYWEEAEDRVKYEKELGDLRKQLVKANARADGIEAKRKYGLELSMQMFDRGSSYSNLIMSAGYAAIFTAWTTSYSTLEPEIARYIGVFALVSLSGFIAWEVIKMIYVAYINRSLARSLQVPDEELAQRLEDWSQVNSKLRIPLKIGWMASLLFTVPTGLAAGLLLIWNLLLPNLYRA